MRLHVSLFCAVLIAHARTATIPSSPASDLQKKLPVVSDDAVKESVIPLDKPSEPVTTDEKNTVKDVENNLRKTNVDSIPVSVIVDGDVSNPVENEVASDVKRVKLDLEHPGEPQRQEHETQNAVHYDDKQNMVSTVEQSVADTQNALKQSFQGVAAGIQDWISNNEQLSAIQASLNNLQENFVVQMNKLNETIHTFWNNRIIGTSPTVETTSNPEIENVESHLKNLENDFKNGVQALSEGVQVYATLKAENENVNPNPTTPVQSPPNNLFVQYLQLLQNTVTQGFNNVTHAIQNFVGQNGANNNTSSGGLLQSFNNGLQNIFNQGSTPAGVQGDEGSTARPTLWQGIQSSLQNILNPGQAQGQAAQGSQNTNPAPVPNRPIANAIQNLPFVQGVVSLIQPNRPQAGQQPAAQEQSAQPAQPIAPGSNVVPAPEKPEPENKEPAKESEKPQPQPETPQPTANGPIRNIIQNNPIVQGISGAVQKLQASVNNPEKPRNEEEAPVKEEASQPDKEVAQPAKQGSEKGYGYGHYGSSNNAGDNNNGSGVVKKAPAEPISVDTKVVEEAKLSVETDKTDKS